MAGVAGVAVCDSSTIRRLLDRLRDDCGCCAFIFRNLYDVVCSVTRHSVDEKEKNDIF